MLKIQNSGRATSNPLEKQEGPKSQYQKSQEINGTTEHGQKRLGISEVSAELYKNEERSQNLKRKTLLESVQKESKVGGGGTRFLKQSNTNDKRKPEKMEEKSFTRFERGGQSDPLQIEQKRKTRFERGARDKTLQKKIS